MSENAYETLRVDRRDDGLMIVTLNRPAVMNAISTQMGRDLLALFTDLSAAETPPRCVVMTGAGDRAFCAGGDLKERNGMTDEQWLVQHALFERMGRAILECPVPLIAAVNGVAFGGGTEIALLADFIYAADTARFALTEVKLGIMPGGGGTQNLPRAVGERRAKEIIFTGAPFSAADALEWGLVNRIFPPGALLDAAIETARTICANAPLSIRQAKKSIHLGLQGDLLTGMYVEIEAYNRLVPTEDRLEGVRAFNERRKPAFKGR